MPRHIVKKSLFLLSFIVLAFPCQTRAQVLVIDSELNSAVMENNRLTQELLDQSQTLTTYTNRLLQSVGPFKNVALDDIRYPTDLLTPNTIEDLGLGQFNATILTTPLAIEAYLQHFVLLNPYEMKEMSEADFRKKYNRSKDEAKSISTSRQLLLARKAIIEGYSIAYVARQKAAATGRFLQEELRERSRQSTSIREDLAIENLALAEIVGQLGTLVAASASELEIISANALLGVSF
jgi:hypothetical protein